MPSCRILRFIIIGFNYVFVNTWIKSIDTKFAKYIGYNLSLPKIIDEDLCVR